MCQNDDIFKSMKHVVKYTFQITCTTLGDQCGNMGMKGNTYHFKTVSVAKLVEVNYMLTCGGRETWLHPDL